MIGTTPTHTLRLLIGTENIKTAHVIYRQGEENILIKVTGGWYKVDEPEEEFKKV